MLRNSCVFLGIAILICITAHGTMFALKGLIKGRGNAAVCDECGFVVIILVQLWYIWHLGNPVALKLKKLQLF